MPSFLKNLGLNNGSSAGGVGSRRRKLLKTNQARDSLKILSNNVDGTKAPKKKSRGTGRMKKKMMKKKTRYSDDDINNNNPTRSMTSIDPLDDSSTKSHDSSRNLLLMIQEYQLNDPSLTASESTSNTSQSLLQPDSSSLALLVGDVKTSNLPTLKQESQPRPKDQSIDELLEEEEDEEEEEEEDRVLRSTTFPTIPEVSERTEHPMDDDYHPTTILPPPQAEVDGAWSVEDQQDDVRLVMAMNSSSSSSSEEESLLSNPLDPKTKPANATSDGGPTTTTTGGGRDDTLKSSNISSSPSDRHLTESEKEGKYSTKVCAAEGDDDYDTEPLHDDDCASSKSKHSSSNGNKKSVSFDHWVTIREYPIILGDNPSVTRGAPLTIDWNYQSEHRVALHTQLMQQGSKLPIDFKLESLERILLLKRQGHSRSEIVDQINEVNVARMKRERTRRYIKFMPIEEFASSIGRFIRKKIVRKKSSSSNDKLVKMRMEYRNLILQEQELVDGFGVGEDSEKTRTTSSDESAVMIAKTCWDEEDALDQSIRLGSFKNLKLQQQEEQYAA